MMGSCPMCGGPPTQRCVGTMSTLVGYVSSCPQGDHDDNCRSKEFTCAEGHFFGLHRRNSCPCGWRGRETCFCHPGPKLDEWPDVPEVSWTVWEWMRAGRTDESFVRLMKRVNLRPLYRDRFIRDVWCTRDLFGRWLEGRDLPGPEDQEQILVAAAEAYR